MKKLMTVFILAGLSFSAMAYDPFFNDWGNRHRTTEVFSMEVRSNPRPHQNYEVTVKSFPHCHHSYPHFDAYHPHRPGLMPIHHTETYPRHIHHPHHLHPATYEQHKIRHLERENRQLKREVIQAERRANRTADVILGAEISGLVLASALSN